MKKNALPSVCLTLLILIPGCIKVKITVSEKRNPIPQSIELGNNLRLTTWGAIKINESHFLPSSFQIKTTDNVIYLDPVEINSTAMADYLFLTHSHPDHFSLQDIRKIVTPETIIVCPKGVRKKLGEFNNTIHMVRPGDTLTLQSIKCEATPAFNTKPVFLWIKAHPESKENVGFVLTLNNGFRIYHAGDTDYIPAMKKLKNIQVALIPIGGDNLTMNADEAALMVNEIRPETVIPMHFTIENQDEVSRFKGQVNENIAIKELVK